MICPGKDNPDVLLLLFPHQDMSDDLYEVAERMTTANLLGYLGFEPEGDYIVDTPKLK